jgi:hypothetical protein
VADLVAEAGRRHVVSDDELEHARLVLDEARLDRAIHRARERGGAEIPDLAREREAVREARRLVTGRLERAV